jgi:hypothetical protein
LCIDHRKANPEHVTVLSFANLVAASLDEGGRHLLNARPAPLWTTAAEAKAVQNSAPESFCDSSPFVVEETFFHAWLRAAAPFSKTRVRVSFAGLGEGRPDLGFI